MTDNHHRRVGQFLLVGVAAAALLSTSAVGSAATSNGAFSVLAADENDPAVNAIRGVEPEPTEGAPGSGGSESPEPTSPVTTPPPTTEPTDPPTTEPPAPAKDDLVAMTINTTLPGCTPSNFHLGLLGGDSSNPGGLTTPVNTEVTWGDGSAVEKISYFGSHSYPSTGTYNLKIKGTLGGFDTLFSGKCVQSVEHFGADTGIRTLENMFNGAQGLQSVAAPPATVTSTARMFKDSSFSGDLSGWKLPNLVSAESMFDGAYNFNSDLTGFAPSGSLKNAGWIFRNAAKFDGDVSGWNTANTEKFYMTFTGATAFQGKGISDWKTDSATTMSQMFFNAKSFTGDLSGWNTSRVTDMNSMFANASKFNGNIGGWDVSKSDSLRAMFYRSTAFTQDLSGWKIKSGADTTNFALESGIDGNRSKLPAAVQ